MRSLLRMISGLIVLTVLSGGFSLPPALAAGTRNFAPGHHVTFGGGDRAYIGDNLPFVGDFNGDGFADLGVKWIGGEHEGLWVISLSDGIGSFQPGEQVRGVVSSTYGPDVNRYVPQLEKQFTQLKEQGDYYGFYTGAGHPDTKCKRFRCYHWQGMARLAYPEQARRYFLAASAHKPESRLATVDTGTTSGLRLRGNRQSATKPDWETPPDPAQRIVHSEPIETYLNHPGGMQTIGQYVAIGMEKIADSVPGKVYLYDVSGLNASNSDPVKQWEVGIAGEKVATASIVKLQPFEGETDSRYLLITLGSDSQKITFNLSRPGKALTSTDAFSIAPNGVTVPEGTLTPDSDVSGWTTEYQTAQVLVDETGQLYLLAAKRTTIYKNYLDLFALDLTLTGGANVDEATPLISSRITRVANKRMKYVSPMTC